MKKIAILILCLFHLSAWSQNTSLEKVENSILIQQASEQVWELVKDVRNLAVFVPDVIEQVEILSFEPHLIWELTLKNGQQVEERMTHFDQTNHSLTYIMTKTPMPLSNYTGIQSVRTIDSNQCEIIFTSTFETTAQHKKALHQSINQFQQTFLNNIKKHIK